MIPLLASSMSSVTISNVVSDYIHVVFSVKHEQC